MFNAIYSLEYIAIIYSMLIPCQYIFLATIAIEWYYFLMTILAVFIAKWYKGGGGVLSTQTNIGKILRKYILASIDPE
jgi:hypothetical protein